MKSTNAGRLQTNHFGIVKREGFLGFPRARRDGNVLCIILLDFRYGTSSALLHLPVTVDAATHLLFVLVEAIGGDEHRLRGCTGFDPGFGYTVVDRLDDGGRFLCGHIYDREC